MKRIFVNSFKTDLGTVSTAATDRGLALVALPGDDSAFNDALQKYFSGWDVRDGGAVNREAQEQITAYLAGKLKKFVLKLDFRGTEFQTRALKQVAKIPYGKTMTYGEVAEAIGSPGASRAVGNANARNNLPLVIPCHRVVAANGLGGYGGGLPMKEKLLQMEGALYFKRVWQK